LIDTVNEVRALLSRTLPPARRKKPGARRIHG